jgi:hypothetical protein
MPPPRHTAFHFAFLHFRHFLRRGRRHFTLPSASAIRRCLIADSAACHAAVTPSLRHSSFFAYFSPIFADFHLYYSSDAVATPSLPADFLRYQHASLLACDVARMWRVAEPRRQRCAAKSANAAA